MLPMLPKSFIKFGAATLAATTCVVTGHAVANAEGLPGITFRWNNREGFNELGHVIELNNEPNSWGRYRLKIGARDMELAVSQFVVNMPDHFDGKFDEDDIEVRICKTRGSFLRRAKCDAVDVDEAVVDMEARQIAIYPAVPVPAGKNVELVFSNVKNPRHPGMYQFNGLVEVPGDVPILRPLGAWIVSIENN